jgi:hypothetical protein
MYFKTMIETYIYKHAIIIYIENYNKIKWMSQLVAFFRFFKLALKDAEDNSL